MRNYFFLIVLSLLSISALAQQAKDTVLNQTDKAGKKQGFWKVKYDNGSLKYTAFFKNGSPVGEMRRYFDDNTLKAVLIFDKTGKKAKAKLYYQAGPLAAEGNYISTLKDSTWKYYSFYTKLLTRTEFYTLGKINGKSITYLASGKASEEVNWKNGVKDGVWKQYYEDGSVKMFSYFANGVRTGAFTFNYPNGIPEWNGKYENDKMVGKWVHFNTKGIPDNTIEYINGKATNQEEIDQKQSDLLKDLEKKKGRIPEPSEDDVSGPLR